MERAVVINGDDGAFDGEALVPIAVDVIGVDVLVKADMAGVLIELALIHHFFVVVELLQFHIVERNESVKKHVCSS